MSEWAVLGMVQLTKLEGHGARVKPHTDPRFYGEFLVTVVLSPSRSSYMLLEYMCGGSMAELLDRDKRLELGKARFYFACVVSAFELLHRYDWIHRDLKLENLMIGNSGHAKVIDLGLAKRMPTGSTFTMCGTPVYMAPELVKGTGYSKPADVWALVFCMDPIVFCMGAKSGFDLARVSPLEAESFSVEATMR